MHTHVWEHDNLENWNIRYEFSSKCQVQSTLNILLEVEEWIQPSKMMPIAHPVTKHGFIVTNRKCTSAMGYKGPQVCLKQN